MTKTQVNDSTLCSFNKLGPIMMPQLLSMQESLRLCQKMNGKIFVIDNQTAYDTSVPLRRDKGRDFCPSYMGTYVYVTTK